MRVLVRASAGVVGGRCVVRASCVLGGVVGHTAAAVSSPNGLFHVAGNVVHRVVGERVVVRARTSRQLLDLREREVVPLAAAANVPL